MLILKTPDEIEIMAEGGRRLAEVLRALKGEARAGMTTKQLDRLAYQLIHRSGAKPAFLHYRPAGARRSYPYTLCASLNDIIVHGQPSDRVIENGDVVKLDLGLVYKGFYLDAAITVLAGEAAAGGAGAATGASAVATRGAKKLITATRQALAAGIAEARAGNTIGDIGCAIGRVIAKNGFVAAEGLVGHGIGRSLHEEPAVFNFGKRGEGMPLEAGMVLAIEPMVVAGRGATITRKDDSYATRDGSLAAHFEHTVAVTPQEPRILTE